MPIDRQATMLAVLGGGASIAGLLLVYQGYLLSALASLPVDASSRLRRPYRVGIFLDHRNERGTRGKYWAVDFADLIVMLAGDDISIVEEADS